MRIEDLLYDVREVELEADPERLPYGRIVILGIVRQKIIRHTETDENQRKNLYLYTQKDGGFLYL